MSRWLRRNRFSHNPYFPKRERRKVPQWIRKIFWLLFPFAVIIGLYFSPVFRFTHVDIQGAEIISASNIEREVREAIPPWQRGILWYQEADLAESLRSRFPLLSAQVHKKFPNRIRVLVVERKPTAFLQVGEEQRILDQTGAVLRAATAEDQSLALPHFSVETIADPQNTTLLDASKIEQAVFALNGLQKSSLTITAMIFPTEISDWMKFRISEGWDAY
ncbi:MAG: FtsQ-type POTRA domain-containing protein, partial [bacterium]|nr:FtsQ-type POTRA domain-containing protein [bacterium]